MAELAAQWDAEGFGPVQRELRTQRLQGRIIADTTADLEAEATRRVRRALGGDGTLSNWPTRGRSTRATVKVTERAGSATVRFEPAGVWALVQEGARPHRIAGRGGRIVTRVRGEWRTGPFRHPGMAPLGDPIGQATDDLDDELEANTDDAIERTFV